MRQVGNKPVINESIRESRSYRELSAYDAVGMAEGFVEANEEQRLAAWQWLHDSGMAYTLQGAFGRMCQALIQHGDIDE